jgi:enamine deaminase RidA (YjgF/YER057c/UK114 family)
MSIKRLEPGARMSQAVIANGFVFLAGQVAPDPSGNVVSQTRQVLGEIDRLLAAAGTSKERILTATIYLADVASFGEMNKAWEAWVPADAKPARATVEAKMVAPEYRVEIQVTALL